MIDSLKSTSFNSSGISITSVNSSLSTISLACTSGAGGSSSSVGSYWLSGGMTLGGSFGLPAGYMLRFAGFCELVVVWEAVWHRVFENVKEWWDTLTLEWKGEWKGLDCWPRSPLVLVGTGTFEKRERDWPLEEQGKGKRREEKGWVSLETEPRAIFVNG